MVSHNTVDLERYERWTDGPLGVMRYQFTRRRPSERDAGPSRPPLLLLHGYGALLEHWQAVVDRLGAFAPCYTLDLYGFGYSVQPTPWPTLADWASQVATFIRNVIGQPVVLVGNSLGGSVAATVAHQAPEQVAALVLVNTTGLPGLMNQLSLERHLFCRLAQLPLIGESTMHALNRPLGVRSFLHALYYRQERITPSLVAALSGPLRRPRTAPLCLHLLRNLETLTLHLQPGDVAQPVLLLWGERDPILPLTIAVRLQRQMLPQGTLRLVPESGHCPFDETPEDFCAILIPWLTTEVY